MPPETVVSVFTYNVCRELQLFYRVLVQELITFFFPAFFLDQNLMVSYFGHMEFIYLFIIIFKEKKKDESSAK